MIRSHFASPRERILRGRPCSAGASTATSLLDLGPVGGVRDDPSAHLARQTAEHFRAGRDRVVATDRLEVRSRHLGQEAGSGAAPHRGSVTDLEPGQVTAHDCPVKVTSGSTMRYLILPDLNRSGSLIAAGNLRERGADALPRRTSGRYSWRFRRTWHFPRLPFRHRTTKKEPPAVPQSATLEERIEEGDRLTKFRSERPRANRENTGEQSEVSAGRPVRGRESCRAG